MVEMWAVNFEYLLLQNIMHTETKKKAKTTFLQLLKYRKL
jgi:hypothetical protein